MKIRIIIEGIKPLLLCRFTDEAQMKASSGTSSSQVGLKPTPYDEAKNFLYTDEQNRPIIPSPMIMGALMEGGKFFKTGRTKITTQKTSLIPACVFISETHVLIKHNHGPSIHDLSEYQQQEEEF